jgi:hypothetical protein
LDDAATTSAFYSDFVGFLYDNPGARQTWIEREEALAHNRKMMNSGQASWYQDVLNGLAKLEARDASPGIKK